MILSFISEFKNLSDIKYDSYVNLASLCSTDFIYLLSKILLEKHQGKVPDKFEDLISLPGVGRKTANVVLNAAFNKATIAVDTHVFRVANRTGLSNGKNPEKVENQLLKILPVKHIKKAHHLILLHGRYICKARNPLCKICVINKICLYKEKYE